MRTLFVLFGQGRGTGIEPESLAPGDCSPPEACVRTTRYRARARRAGRQNRPEPAHERDAGGDGAGAVQVVVRRLRAGARQDGGPRHRLAQARLRSVPGPLREVEARRQRSCAARLAGWRLGGGRRDHQRRHAPNLGAGVLGRRYSLVHCKGRAVVQRRVRDRHRADHIRSGRCPLLHADSSGADHGDHGARHGRQDCLPGSSHGHEPDLLRDSRT